MRILAIESSCDETASAVVENGTNVLSSVISTTQDFFSEMGGVVPEEAARKQVECIVPVVNKSIADAKMKLNEIDAIAVTKGPGLLGSLLIGTTAGRLIASICKKPIIGVHHTLGHLSSVWLECSGSDAPTFPCLTLSASGGHTDLWYRSSHLQGLLVGCTHDDAAGEAFDKGASMMGLPYPGGPSISKAAEKGDPTAFEFPRPLKGKDGCDFSFSGLKTALKYTLRDSVKDLDESLSDLAASYQHAICQHLVDRIRIASDMHSDANEIHIVGGVSANTHLREMIASDLPDLILRTPRKISYCTDNAAMIGAAAYFIYQEMGDKCFESFKTETTIPLSEVLH